MEITPSKSALRKKYKEAIQHLWNSQGVEGKPDPEQINETFSKHLGDDTPVKGFET